MMVIQGTSLAGDGTAGVKIHPADRCTWTYANPAYDGGNYELATAHYESGHEAALPITNPVLGVIGKSGRFVGFTV